MSREEGVVVVDRPVPLVARLRINRPDKRNAIDLEVRQALMDAIDRLLGDRSVRALVFGGVGGMFSAGGDLASMAGLDADGARARMQHIHRLCRQIAAIPLPVVCAVEGVGAGAAVGLALLGDCIVVGEGTKILFPFLKIGLTPDWGQLLTLPARIGPAQARRVLSAGIPVSGAEAQRIGLADALTPDDDVMAAALRKAQELAALPSLAFERTKVRLGLSATLLAQELEREEADQVICLQSAEFAEGFAAFKDKRAPDFVNLVENRP
ncbi:2,3-dehydroadipyl-CoA hydratase (plasmid) [Variovorax sp. SRS16]|uniref:enoyl-CoA hydratase/isomerase family protein n=1 Tax=Variovorax sp. SRS16 TaxID=282217 RepID=UPI001318E8B2|nr:enoyl-CoA hydratase-related protein [Variovorax sp. SRS16]VTU45563.1 2,3-dehydroadipyl-CoA hydratase [Variovorax sp. SRS16]